MNRGTVMELNKRTAVVLTPDGQFVRVKRLAHFEVGEEITVVASMRGAPRIRQRLLQAGMLASVMLLILVGLSMFRTTPVVAYVTMDINPSIELGLDAKERVRELRALNEDAEALIEGMKYRGKDLETVMNELARKLVDKHILTQEDGEVVIASVPMKALEEQWEKNVMQKMTRILGEATRHEDSELKINLDVTTVSLPVEVRDEAKANGVSSGKMAFWLISESQGHDLSLDTLKKQSLKKIAASWGGVNKVMSNYEQKKEANKEKEDMEDNDDKEDENDLKVKDSNGDMKNDNIGNNNSDKNNGNSEGSNSNKNNDENKGADIKDNEKDNKKDNKKVDLEVDLEVDIEIDNEVDNKETWKQMLDDAKEKSRKLKSSESKAQSEKTTQSEPPKQSEKTNSSDKPRYSGKEEDKGDRGDNKDDKNDKK